MTLAEAMRRVVAHVDETFGARHDDELTEAVETLRRAVASSAYRVLLDDVVAAYRRALAEAQSHSPDRRV